MPTSYTALRSYALTRHQQDIMQPPSGSDLTSSQPALSARLSHATVGLVDEAIHRQLPHTVLYDLLYDDCFAETCNKRRASHTLLCSLNGVKWTGRENLAYALDLPISALRDLDGRASAIISCSHPTYVFEVRMNKCQIQITFATMSSSTGHLSESPTCSVLLCRRAAVFQANHRHSVQILRLRP